MSPAFVTVGKNTKSVMCIFKGSRMILRISGITDIIVARFSKREMTYLVKYVASINQGKEQKHGMVLFGSGRIV